MPKDELIETLRRKLRGYYQYYGITDNREMLSNYFDKVKQHLHEEVPLASTENLRKPVRETARYWLHSVNGRMKSRMREICKSGSVRGACREARVYSTHQDSTFDKLYIIIRNTWRPVITTGIPGIP